MINTELTFDLRAADGGTAVRFTNARWAQVSDCPRYRHPKRATYLLSLKRPAEIAKSTPWAHDMKI